MFPYYDEKSEHVFNKFRYPRKLAEGEKKAWRESDTMPVLYGMWKCDYGKPLLICEGEFDAMACHEAGLPNAVSVPSGAEDFTWVDTCWDFIQRFGEIYVFGDNDAPGLEMTKRISVKLSEKRVFVVEHECKDANELLHRKGKNALKAAYEAAKEVAVAGLIKLSSVLPIDATRIETICTSIAELDKRLGGFMYGDVTVWTGKRGEGKSTLLSQIMLDAVDGGKNVCSYSGELRADRFQYWTDLQAAGKPHIKGRRDEKSGKTQYYVEAGTRKRIHDWYDDKYWIYDNIAATSEEDASILKIFEIAAKRYDCRVFLVDNLMTADYGRTTDTDFYRQQSRFVGQLVSFANRHNCHVHLVAHPRKAPGKLSSDDVSGTVDITNRAANVISVERTAREKDGCDVIIDVKKNRWDGSTGHVKLNYCNVSHRIYDDIKGDPTVYGWQGTEEAAGNVTVTDAADDDLPWDGF
jgi:twinkle protein